MSIKLGFCAVLVGVTLSSPLRADSDRNIQTMIEAARQLTWENWQGDNRAQLLVKQETIVAPVAVVFGYADHAVACEELATVLSQPASRVGTFKCQPVF
ncbi:MAG: hypothetical protein WBB13_17970 [Tabrizicola sp.]